jgi:dolichol-phosphate mannosyltransferase
MHQISIVIPVYNAENIINELVERLHQELFQIASDFEIILIEDGALDKSWEKIEENCKKSNKVKGIKLSKNFG